jgi:lia operon protein LiaG
MKVVYTSHLRKSITQKFKKMKPVNYFFSLSLLLFSAITLRAQDYKIPVQNTKDGKLTLNDFSGDLPIEGYSGNEIIITSDHPGKPPERAKGLQPVYAAGNDNTGIGISLEKNGSHVTLQCLLPITQSANYKIKVPDNFSIEVDNECGNSGDVTAKNMKGEVEIKNCQSIKLVNVSGPLVLSTISGDVEIVFQNVTKDKPVSIASVSGEIDVTVPAKAGVNVELETISGAIYSDFEFPSDDKKMKRIGGNEIKTALNGGGVDFKISNVSGNIYLRKGQ